MSQLCIACSRLTQTQCSMAFAVQPTQASNYLGHFYLTHLLLQNLTSTPQSRIVNLTSLVEPNGSIEWTDVGSVPPYQTCCCAISSVFAVDMKPDLTSACMQIFMQHLLLPSAGQMCLQMLLLRLLVSTQFTCILA